MKINRLTILFVTVAIILALLVMVALTQEPPGSDSDLATEEGILVFQADPHALQPCGAFEAYRQMQSPALVTPAPTNTTDFNTTTATMPPPTNTPRPAPTEDRVGFPENYATEYTLLLIFDRPDRRWVRIICGNDIAVQRQAGEAFAYGSV